MPGFTKGPSYRTPFGKNEYLRSTVGVKDESYTVAASTIVTRTVDGEAKKILQPGTVMAKITSGVDSGKIGPYDVQVATTDGRQTAANIVGLAKTFLPWQLDERDVEIAVSYECTAVQAWCLEVDAAGAYVALTDTTADTMYAVKTLDITFA